MPIFDGGEQTPTPHPRSTTIVPIQCFFNPVICEVCLIFQTDLGMVDIVITNVTNMTDKNWSDIKAKLAEYIGSVITQTEYTSFIVPYDYYFANN